MLLDLLGTESKVLWKGKSNSEINTDGLHAVINTPVIDGDYIYGICSYGRLRCLNAKTGECSVHDPIIFPQCTYIIR